MFSDPTWWPWLFVGIATLVTLLYGVLSIIKPTSMDYYMSGEEVRTWPEEAEERLREVVQERNAEIAKLRKSLRDAKTRIAQLEGAMYQ